MGWLSDYRQFVGRHPTDDGDQPAQVQSTPDLGCQVPGRVVQLSASGLIAHFQSSLLAHLIWVILYQFYLLVKILQEAVVSSFYNFYKQTTFQ